MGITINWDSDQEQAIFIVLEGPNCWVDLPMVARRLRTMLIEADRKVPVVIDARGASSRTSRAFPLVSKFFRDLHYNTDKIVVIGGSTVVRTMLRLACEAHDGITSILDIVFVGTPEDAYETLFGQSLTD